MKIKIWRALLAIAMVSALVVVPVSAQRSQGGAGRMYNPATEVTIKGTVEEVKQIPGPGGGPGGLHLVVKADQGLLEVDLGPTTFVEKRGFKFAKGDQIEVIGSKVKIEGGDRVIAREIKKGDKVLILRNTQGVPAWSRGRRRSS